MEYDNRGQAALWKSTSDNPKAPALRGTMTAHRDIKEGEEIELAFWRSESDNDRAPVLKGKAKDKFKEDRELPTFSSSDIPF
jgi:SET domain-containing protein